MQILKDLCLQFRKWKSLEEYISRIEAYPTNGPLIADNCKCIIEQVCKTILEDLGVQKSDHKRHLHELTKQTVEKLGCINKSSDMVAAFTTTAQKIGEFRNEYTETGHGQSVYVADENRKKITQITIDYMVAMIEQTALYLIMIYQDEYPQLIRAHIRYEDQLEFNSELDETIDSIEIGPYGPYSPSELLFNIDKSAYMTELINYNQLKDEPNI